MMRRMKHTDEVFVRACRRCGTLGLLGLVLAITTLIQNGVANTAQFDKVTIVGLPKGTKLPVVTDRAAGPVDIHAHGMDLTGPGAINMSIPIADGRISLPFDNWNTIAADSGVPAWASVTADPIFHPTLVTMKRFQYLADLISLFNVHGFCPIGVEGTNRPGTYVEVATIYNQTHSKEALRDLVVVLSDTANGKTVGDEELFQTEPFRLGPESMYFLEVQFGLNAPSTGLPKELTYSFHWGSILPATPSCSTTSV